MIHGRNYIEIHMFLTQERKGILIAARSLLRKKAEER